MADIKQFATQISGHRQKNEELKPEARAAICSAVASGQSKAEVARAFNVSYHTVYLTIRRWRERHDNASKPRQGRSKKLSIRDERHLIRLYQQSPKAPWSTLVAIAGVDISKSTFQRLMRKHKKTRLDDRSPEPPAPPRTSGANSETSIDQSPDASREEPNDRPREE